MTIAAGALSYVAYIAEEAWGTTPDTPELTSIPFVDFSMNTTKVFADDNSTRADRIMRYAIAGNQQVAGDMTVNLSHANFDVLLASMLNNTWATNVLKAGVTRSSLTVEAGNTDINQFQQYTGVIVDKMTLAVPVTGVVTAKFSMIGKQQTNSTSTIDTTPGITAAGEYEPFVHNAGTFKEGGSTVGYLTSIDMTIDNGNTANFSLGSNYARDLSVSFTKITGTVNAWFEDVVMYNKFLNNTASSIDFTLTDGTNTLEIKLPAVTYTGATRTITGNGPIVLAMPFSALYDTGTSSNIVITRSA